MKRRPAHREISWLSRNPWIDPMVISSFRFHSRRIFLKVFTLLRLTHVVLMRLIFFNFSYHCDLNLVINIANNFVHYIIFGLWVWSKYCDMDKAFDTLGSLSTDKESWRFKNLDFTAQLHTHINLFSR